MTATPVPARSAAGRLGTALLLLVFAGIAVSIDFPKASLGFKGDEATYYSMTHSLARDRDFAFERDDLVRVWEEYPGGPEGIFLKRGRNLDLQRAPTFPFFRVERTPVDAGVRLYYGKAFIYPLAAAPFVMAFGTGGFLLFHAGLLALNFAAAYVFLAARTARPLAAGFAAVFLFASIVPVYFVWLTPELFNVTLVLQAYFLWCYKLVVDPARRAAAAAGGRLERALMGPGSDYAAAVLLGIATFSKPTHLPLVMPLLLYGLWRRDLLRTAGAGALFTATAAGLFLANAAITGEMNFQGGERCSFYGRTGFPYANAQETFDTVCQPVATDTVRSDILVHRDTSAVLGWNLLYFTLGRYSGLVPYFFPGMLLLALFLRRRAARQGWQWLVLGTLAVTALAILLYMPYTYSGGGGPVGNRYFLAVYPLFLFLAPPLGGAAPAVAAAAVGALFVGKILLNPFYSSFHPGEHAKAGPLRLLPIERTLLNDLPVSADAGRSRRPIGGTPPLAAYFVDDNAYPPEGEWFWVKGNARADVLLRVPIWRGPNERIVPLRIRRLDVEVENGGAANRVTLRAGWRRITLDLAPGEVRTAELPPGQRVPYKPSIYPTNYVYSVSVATAAGSVPFLDAPGESSDSRYLGARIRIVPVYFNP